MNPLTPALVVRNALPQDAAALAALLAELGFPAPASVVADRLRSLSDAGAPVLVAVRGEIPVGLLTLHVMSVLHRPARVGRLTALVVTAAERGRGVGRALVAAAERTLAARGCGLVEVTSNRERPDAHAFYQHLGYEVTSLRFKKSLAPAG